MKVFQPGRVSSSGPAYTRPILYLRYMKRSQHVKLFFWWPAAFLIAAGASFGQQPAPPGQGTPAAGRGGLPGGGAPQGPPPTYANLEYAPPEPATSNGHKLDLYIPAGATRPLPVVIWTGGSAWRADTGKNGAGSLAAQLNPAGYAVAGVSIRSSSQVLFPGQLHDIKAAIRWLRANAG